MAMRAWKLLLLCTCRILAKKLCTHYFQCTYQVSRSIQQSFLPFCWIIHFIIQWMTRTWSYLKQNTMGKFLNRNHWWVWFIIWCWLYQSRSSLNVVTPPPHYSGVLYIKECCSTFTSHEIPKNCIVIMVSTNVRDDGLVIACCRNLQICSYQVIAKILFRRDAMYHSWDDWEEPCTQQQPTDPSALVSFCQRSCCS